MFKLKTISAAALAVVCAAASASAVAQSLPDDSSSVDTQAVTVTSSPVLTTPGTLATAAPTAAERTARAVQPWLNQANVPYANQLGSGNGSGVVVGVVDTGVQVDHPELKGQIVATYNALNGGTDVTDQMGHGTHVSGLIAGTLANGAPAEGVAPGVKIAMAKAFATGSSDSVTIGKGIDWVVNVQKAPILSLSLGSATVSMQSNIQNAVAKGTLITAALGNDSNTKGASWPAEFAKVSWANGQIIAVGALDANNKRAYFSNYDATLANWTVYAPGVNIISSYSVPTMKNSYAGMSGTSMATPIVAGQAALIKSNWNFLTAQQIAQVIFQSATHLCSDSVSAAVCASRTAPDAMYGWGLVNVGASLQPIGGLNIGTSKGTAISAGSTQLGSAKSGIASGLAGVSTLAVDKFNRGFNVLVPISTAKTLGLSAVASPASTTVKAGGVKFSADYAAVQTTQDAMGLVTDAQEVTFGKANLSFTSKQGTSYAFGTGSSDSSYFGLDSTGLTPLSLSSNGSRFNAPYFGLAENATHMGYGIALSDGSIVRMGLVNQSTVADGSLFGTANSGTAKSVATLELQKKFGDVTTVTTLGQMLESGSVLGLTGQGAVGLDANASTTFVSFAANKPLSEKVSISAMASIGNTAGFANNTAASLIDGMSDSLSAAWSIGLAQKDVWRNGDKLGFTVAMPLRTMTGTMNMTTAVSQDSNTGALQYASQAVGLAPSGMEKDLELAYARTLTGGATVSAMAQAKLQPGHDANAPTQYGLGVRYVKAF